MIIGRTVQAYSSMQLTYLLLFLGIFGIHVFSCHGQVDPLALSRADPQCWESSTAKLLEMKKPRIADSVPEFWDFMIYLKSSDNLKHGVLFWDLAQLFWDIYVHCVLSRAHGLGRRQLDEGEKKVTNFIAQYTSSLSPPDDPGNIDFYFDIPNYNKNITNGIIFSNAETFSQNRRPLPKQWEELLERLKGINVNKSESRLLGIIKRHMKRK